MAYDDLQMVSISTSHKVVLILHFVQVHNFDVPNFYYCVWCGPEEGHSHTFDVYMRPNAVMGYHFGIFSHHKFFYLATKLSTQIATLRYVKVSLAKQIAHILQNTTPTMRQNKSIWGVLGQPWTYTGEWKWNVPLQSLQSAVDSCWLVIKLSLPIKVINQHFPWKCAHGPNQICIQSHICVKTRQTFTWH